MSRPTQPIRDHHASLMSSLSSFYEVLNGLDSMSDEMAKGELDNFVKFFREDLEPHADGEEDALYPAVEQLIKEHGTATASMSMDHVHLKRLISEFVETAENLAAASSGEVQSLRKASVRLGYQIYGILTVHFAKEEDIYLELADEHLTAEQVKEIVHKMHHH